MQRKPGLALKGVKRGRQCRDIEARLLVPGDLIAIRLGSSIPADLKVPEGKYLSIAQSALAGESLPVDKKACDEAYS